MNYNVIPSEKFKKEAERLIKKFPSLKQELSDLGKLLSVNPKSGAALGNSIYKIRVAIKQRKRKKWWRASYNLCNF